MPHQDPALSAVHGDGDDTVIVILASAASVSMASADTEKGVAVSFSPLQDEIIDMSMAEKTAILFDLDSIPCER